MNKSKQKKHWTTPKVNQLKVQRTQDSKKKSLLESTDKNGRF